MSRQWREYGDISYDQPNNESFTQKLKESMLPLQLPVPSKEHLKVRCTKVLNLLNLGVGLGHYVLLLSLRQVVYQYTCLTLFHKPIIYTILISWKML